MKINYDLTQSQECYLNAIYDIVREQKAARVKDVSLRLKVGASSTSDAVKALAEKKFINYQPYGLITLTSKGRKNAESIIARNSVISNFMKDVLMLDDNEVTKNVGKFESSLPKSVYERFIRFLSFMQTCSCKEPKWMSGYKYYAKNGKVMDSCKNCVSGCSTSDGQKPCCAG